MEHARQLTRLIDQIQALTRELEALRLRGHQEPNLHEQERARERLRWKLAVVARRAAVESDRQPAP